jgi:ATP-binding cassette subfamily A (ABC1) protein 3
MLIYSVIYLLLAIYVERVNPGEFGVAQSWNYIFKKSYWKPQATSSVRPGSSDEGPRYQNGGIRPMSSNGEPGYQNGGIFSHNHWIELNPMTSMKNLSLTVSHLTKVND